MIFALKWQLYWIFTFRVKTNVGIMIPLCFLYFKTWVCTPKCIFMTNVEKNYMILGYNNRESWPMVAILNKKISSTGILGDFSPGCLVGIQVTFLNISAFYFFPGRTLMLLGYEDGVLFMFTYLWQLLSFLISSISSLLGCRPLLRRVPHNSNSKNLVLVHWYVLKFSLVMQDNFNIHKLNIA